MRTRKLLGKTATAVTVSAVLAVSAICIPAAAKSLDTRLSTAVVMYVGSSLAYVNGDAAFIDPDNPFTAPQVENDRALVPLRFVSEAFKAEVNWDAGTKTATVKHSGKTIKFTEGSREMITDGKVTDMDTPAKNIDGSFYIPLRFMAGAMGREAFYDRGLIIISDKKDIYDPITDKAALDSLIEQVNNLPVVGTEENFVNLVGEAPVYSARGAEYGILSDVVNSMAGAGAMKESAAPDAAPPMPSNAPAPMPAAEADRDQAFLREESVTAQKAEDSSSSSSDQDYSKTNVQVEGVDEGDIIKTDGRYIYYSRGNRVIVVKATPADQLEIEYDVTFDDESFYPVEIYVDGDRMAVIGNTQKQTQIRPGEARPYYNYRALTRTYVFDLTDKANVKKIREIDSEGNYSSSRKIGKTMYVLSEAYAYGLVEDTGYVTPAYRDTAGGEDYIGINYDRIRYFPNFQSHNITTVMGFDLSDTSKKAIINTFLGAGGNIYVSNNNLYVAQEKYYFKPMLTRMPQVETAMPATDVPEVDYGGETSSIIYKFSLNAGNVTFLCKNNVAGTVLNQFSMDESNGFFRVATTGYDYNSGKQSNNMFVLDGNLKLTGNIRDIAPGERIYSARFMGDRAYMVTFKTVDPLFVIDLKDPYNPKILGALKIPGYSNYLHPYDANHLIGFGKDTVEQYGNAYYKGMKISMFDVSDVANPKELFTEFIGDRGTDSDLLSNHRALLFSKERNIMAFPVSLYEVKNQSGNSANTLDYGQFTFQGAYVYGIDMDKGFQLKGRITHLTDQDYLKAGMYDGDYNKYIRRIVYIGDYFYTASNSIIKATAMDGLKDVASVTLPEEEYDRVYKD